MPAIKVSTQSELDAALATEGIKNGDDCIQCVGNGQFVFRDYDGLIMAVGSDAPTMVAWGSSSPTMEARDSSSPRMVALGSSKITGRIGKYAAAIVIDHGGTFDVPGATVIKPPVVDNPTEPTND